jgi:methylglutaconyl-CoA hydratase
MTNPISDPLVENVISEDVALAPVSLSATEDGIATVILNRPDRGNAFDGPTIAALTEMFETLKGAEGVRLVCLRGRGGHFSAGRDLDWIRMAADWSEGDLQADAMATAAMLRTLDEIPALTVALVEGLADGIGAGLVAACDVAIATADARFAFSDVKIGVIPAMISPYVIRAIGPRAAKALFATGRAFDSTHALAIGLIHGVAPDPAGLDAALASLVVEIKTSAPGAIEAVKDLVDHVTAHPISHGLMEDAAHRLTRVRLSEEGREGLAAIVANRPPAWAL